MSERATRTFVTWFWIAIACVVLIGGELLIINLVSLDGIHQQENHASQQTNEKEAPCEHIKAWTSYSGPMQQYACTVLFKNFVFIDAYHDTINALSALAVALFTFTLWRSTNKLWDAAKRQFEQTADLFIAENRPWLDLSDPAIEISDDMERVEFYIKAENIGKTPAKLAEIRVKVTRSQIAAPGSLVVLNFCSSLKGRSKWADFQRTIFPGDPVKLTAMDDRDIHVLGRGGDFFRLVYCATYQAMDSKKIFRSGGEILFTAPNERNSLHATDDESGKGLFRLVHFTSDEGVTFAN
jgi:hypothetical protein